MLEEISDVGYPMLSTPGSEGGRKETRQMHRVPVRTGGVELRSKKKNKKKKNGKKEGMKGREPCGSCGSWQTPRGPFLGCLLRLRCTYVEGSSGPSDTPRSPEILAQHCTLLLRRVEARNCLDMRERGGGGFGSQ